MLAGDGRGWVLLPGGRSKELIILFGVFFFFGFWIFVLCRQSSWLRLISIEIEFCVDGDGDEKNGPPGGL